MVTRELIDELIRRRLNQVLLIGEASLPESQFRAFRKLTLDQFGKSGLEKDLERVFEDRTDKGRQGLGRDRLRERRSEP